MKESIAAGILTIMLFFIIVIPLVIIAHSLIQQASEIYTTTNIENIKELFINQLNIDISESTQNYINSITKTALEGNLNEIKGIRFFSLESLAVDFITEDIQAIGRYALELSKIQVKS